MFEDFTKGVKNEAAVLGQVLSDAPGAVWDEIKNDWNHHSGKLLKKEGIALAIGLGTGIALARSPFLAKGVLSALFGYQAYSLGQSTVGVMGRAWNADTETMRHALASEATKGLSRAGADILETTPAFMVGGGAGLFATSRSSSLRGFATSVQERVSNPAEFGYQQVTGSLSGFSRSLVPSSMRERFAFVGPGTKQLPAELIAADGRINMMEATRLMAELHPAREQQSLVHLGGGRFGKVTYPAEQWASVRLSDMKVSRTQSGDQFGVTMPFPDRSGRLMFHTHPPEGMSATYPVAGARPSIQDLGATMDTGIIQSGPITTIYQGAARELGASRLSGETFQPTLRAFFLDREQQLAAELVTQWHPELRTYQPAVVRPVNYSRAVDILSAWDRKWSSISDMPTDYDVMANLANPRLFEFLKLGVYKSAGS